VNKNFADRGKTKFGSSRLFARTQNRLILDAKFYQRSSFERRILLILVLTLEK